MSRPAAPRALIFATHEAHPEPTDDDRCLADAFAGAGVQVKAVPWTAIGTDGRVPVLLRSTWDYQHRPQEFRAWLQAATAAGRRIVNPPATVAWNIDKAYLLDLQEARVALPRTCRLDTASAAALLSVLEREQWDAAVLKPRISASAQGTMLCGPSRLPDDADLAPGSGSGWLVQEFLPEIRDAGELSLVYLGGAFSHAVRKRPAAGDFRIQAEFGGTVEPVSVCPDARVVADAALAQVPRPWVYARVDIVESARGPLLMEVELIEPELFFRHAPDAAPALVRRLLEIFWPPARSASA